MHTRQTDATGHRGTERERRLPPGFRDRERVAGGGRTESVGVVIPSTKSEVRTVESLPADVERRVVTDGTITEARNAGIEGLDTDIVVVMDDDIAFPEATFDALVDRVDPDTLLGMEDWNYGWVAGRVMVFYRSLWEDVGGFEERLGSHMGDTEFALRALAGGYRIETVDRDCFDHRDHDRDVSAADHLRGFGLLARRYPLQAPRIALGLALGMLTRGDPWLKDRLLGGRTVDLLDAPSANEGVDDAVPPGRGEFAEVTDGGGAAAPDVPLPPDETAGRATDRGTRMIARRDGREATDREVRRAIERWDDLGTAGEVSLAAGPEGEVSLAVGDDVPRVSELGEVSASTDGEVRERGDR